MLSRRAFCGCATFATAAFLAERAAATTSQCAVFTRARQQDVSPDQAIGRLMDGNARFVAGHTVNCDLIEQVKATAQGQAPFAAVVGCIDSRVPPEMVFDQRIGDIFCARIAGNFVNTDMIGSLEFATRIAGARAILVLGHSECGAIKGAIDDVRMGELTATLANIRPAVTAVRIEGERSSKNPAMVQAVADTNARMAAQMLTDRSAVLRDLVNAGALRIAAAMHDITSGQVRLLA